ncbi:MAG TPA: hypothetical protein VGH27_22735 [Streptosporangiaceae bacterium]|jgi:Flp pilus assembly CpaF family ATPase
MIVGLLRFTGEPKCSNDLQKRSWSGSADGDIRRKKVIIPPVNVAATVQQSEVRRFALVALVALVVAAELLVLVLVLVVPVLVVVLVAGGRGSGGGGSR